MLGMLGMLRSRKRRKPITVKFIVLILISLSLKLHDFNRNTFMEVPHLFKQVTEVHYFKWLETVMLSLLGCVFDFNFCKGADEVDLTKRVHPFCVSVSNTYNLSVLHITFNVNSCNITKSNDFATLSTCINNV